MPRSGPRARTWPSSRAPSAARTTCTSRRIARERSRIVVALGDCAVTGNVPSMRNGIPTRKLLERIYVEGVSEQPGVPTDGVPPLLQQAEPLHAFVEVDVHVPGCPPKPEAILMVLGELLEGRLPDVGTKLRFG